jgi:UDP-2-acetamido-2-deoxy-ribo-hexuluronate aminotransferase
MEFIDLESQYKAYQASIDKGIAEVLKHGRFIMGPEVAELESQLAAYVGVKHCVTTASGTDSLEIALRALGVGPGDEVITVPFTWISTAEVIKLVGAKPVFVDIEPDTYNIDASKIREVISPATKAIIPVSLFGQIPDLDEINRIAKEHSITVIEDAAQSFGATQKGHRSCSLTEIASTSFFPAKPFGCYGDGGALFTNDSDHATTMKSIRSHGGERRHHHTLVGMNGRFDTIQAAVLLAKLPHFQGEVTKRQELGARYSEGLKDVCTVPGIGCENTHVYGQYTIRVLKRQLLQEELKAQGIPTAVYYPKCLHEQPVFADLKYRLGDFPESERASHEVVSLPMHPFLSEGDQVKVVDTVKRALRA